MNTVKLAFRYLAGADLWRSRLGVMVVTAWLSMIWYVVDWCSFTTFRAMSDPLLYVNNLLAALVLTVPYLLSRRVWVQMSVLGIADVLLVANIMYGRTYLTDIPLESFALVGNLGDFTASIGSSVNLLDLGFPAILAVGAWWGGRAKPDQACSRIARYAAAFCVVALISAVMTMARGGFYKDYDRMKESCYYSTCGSPVYTLAGHVAYSMMALDNLDNEDRAGEVDEWLEVHSSLMPSPGLPDSVAPRRNLVIIICESLESWLVGAEVGGKPVTPFLNSLVTDSTTFYAPTMISQVASGRSIDCQLLLMAGLLPTYSSVYSMKYPASTYPSLNKALRADREARSYLFTSDKPITWNQEVIARSFGYDGMFDRADWEIDELIGNPGKLSDGSFFRQCVNLLRRGDLWPEGDPAMLTFITYSGHNPFRLPEEFHDPEFDLSGVDLPPLAVDYITINHYVDAQLHILLDYLRSRSDWDETMVVILGDHEGLASWRSELRASSADAAALIGALPATPFIIVNSPVAGRHDGIIGQIDMYPTILDLMGLDEYQWRGLGQSILASDYHSTAISSMTLTHYGDTTIVAPKVLDHINKARQVSDAIIRHDLLRSKLPEESRNVTRD